MPARSHPVPTSLWGRRFRALTPGAKLVHVYVLSCPHRRSEGIFELAPQHVSVDTGLDVDRVIQALGELHDAGFLEVDLDAELVLDPDALKVSPIRNGSKVDKSTGERVPAEDKRLDPAVRHFELLPASPLKARFVEVAEEASPDLAAAIRARGGDLRPPPTRAPSEGPLDGGSEGASTGASARGSQAPSRVEPLGDESSLLLCGVDGCKRAAAYRDSEDDHPVCAEHTYATFGELVELEGGAA